VCNATLPQTPKGALTINDEPVDFFPNSTRVQRNDLPQTPEGALTMNNEPLISFQTVQECDATICPKPLKGL
jgi:hypothetical protein